MPFFSVIIPCFNRIDFVQAALDSVFAQEFKDYEIIVVDDGSTDGTWETLQPQALAVRLFRQANAGPAAARNLGLKHAIGEYVAFLDSDDLWFPWTLATYKEALTVHGFPSSLQARDRHFSDPAELDDSARDATNCKLHRDFIAASGDVDYYGASWWVAKRELLRNAGGFDTVFYSTEDLDLRMRLGNAPGFVVLEAPVTFGYRVHGGNIVKQFRKACEGISTVLDRELQGQYPGGAARAHERRRLLGKAIRPYLVRQISDGSLEDAAKWYRQMFNWHLREGRLRFLVGAPVLMARQALSRRRRNASPAEAS